MRAGRGSGAAGQRCSTAGTRSAPKEVDAREDHSGMIPARKTPPARPDRVIGPYRVRPSSGRYGVGDLLEYLFYCLSSATCSKLGSRSRRSLGSCAGISRRFSTVIVSLDGAKPKYQHKEDAGDSDCYVTPVVTSSHITTESNGTYNEEEKRDVK